MENKKTLREALFISLHILPFVYLFLVYSGLPDMVPTHFNIQGEPDDYSKKQTLIWILLAMNVLGYLLFLVIPKIDPSRFAERGMKIYNRIRIGITLLFVILSLLIVYMANGDPLKGIFALAVVFVLLNLFLGNYLQAIKTNYFIGIRTPWTLSNENVWRKTHLLAGRMLFYGGLISIPFIFLLPSKWAPVPPVAILLIGSVFGLVYSYIAYTKEKKEAV